MQTYNPSLNPFVRGFNELQIQRVMAILYDSQAPLCYLPPHPSQQHLSDEQLERKPCLFNDTHALIVTADTDMTEHEDTYPHPGIVVQVIYEIYAHDQSPPLIVGDLYSQVIAQQRVRQLTFETGRYSRCWEITSAHLPPSVWSHLEVQARRNLPTGLLFEMFTIPASLAIGFKLIATPWNTPHLINTLGITVRELYNEQVADGFARELLDILHLAAKADVRILIFDPDADYLEGLPSYNEPVF